MGKDLESRVAELEDEIQQLKWRLEEARADRDDAFSICAQQRELLEENVDVWERMVSAFGMNQKADGSWDIADWVEEHDRLVDEHQALRAEFNKFTNEYNSSNRKPRSYGRPLAASPAQAADVKKRRKAGETLRAIADEVNLSLRTVRTIVDKDNGVDRATLARLDKIAPDKAREARERANRKTRKALPAQINALIERNNQMQKRAKGTLSG